MKLIMINIFLSTFFLIYYVIVGLYEWYNILPLSLTYLSFVFLLPYDYFSSFNNEDLPCEGLLSYLYLSASQSRFIIITMNSARLSNPD